MSWLTRPSLLFGKGVTNRLLTTLGKQPVQPLLHSHLLRFTSKTTQTSEQNPSNPSRKSKEQNYSIQTQPPQSQSQSPDHTPTSTKAPNPSPSTTTPTTTPITNINIDNKIKTHQTYHTLTHNPNYTLSRPHLQIPAYLCQNHLVAGALSGPGKISTPTYVFSSSSPSQQQVVTLFHAGPQVSGHPGFMQGGFMAVMFDEAFAKCVAMVVPSGVGMTVNISVDFRSPARLDRVFVLEAWVVKAQGRKVWVEGVLRTGDGIGGKGKGEKETVVSEAKALFVSRGLRSLWCLCINIEGSRIETIRTDNQTILLTPPTRNMNERKNHRIAVNQLKRFIHAVIITSDPPTGKGILVKRANEYVFFL